MGTKIITFGEIMLRLSTPGHLRFCQSDTYAATFGGGEANVAVSLANFGLETEFITRLPKNDIANACLMELRKHGVGTRHILYGGDRLGIYFLETGAVARASKVVYDRAHSAISAGNDRLENRIQWSELVSLDRHHASHLTRSGRGMPRGDQGCQRTGYNRIMRSQFPQESLEIR